MVQCLAHKFDVENYDVAVTYEGYLPELDLPVTCFVHDDVCVITGASCEENGEWAGMDLDSMRTCADIQTRGDNKEVPHPYRVLPSTHATLLERVCLCPVCPGHYIIRVVQGHVPPMAVQILMQPDAIIDELCARVSILFEVDPGSVFYSCITIMCYHMSPSPQLSLAKPMHTYAATEGARAHHGPTWT